MGEKTILDKIKDIIRSIAFPIFLWSIDMTHEQYWEEIYFQEKHEREKPFGEPFK